MNIWEEKNLRKAGEILDKVWSKTVIGAEWRGGLYTDIFRVPSTGISGDSRTCKSLLSPDIVTCS